MKTTGIVRKVDELGRIVLPIELRRILDIAVKDELEISVEGEKVILQKRASVCTFCGSDQGLVRFKDKYVCQSCIRNLTHF